ncbi:MAG: septal ring lytic transglycosylase RlpA family protein [Hyphomicrobiales bacterium]|nr:septal ring lytic transglycosylase RlpA family protein [Hyphomicrobiales bacterium]
MVFSVRLKSIFAGLVWRLLVAACVLWLPSCGGVDGGMKAVKDESMSFSPRVVDLGEPVPKGGGVVKVGIPYTIAGQTFVPRADPAYDKIGTASWYGVMFHGRKTSNGEIYDMEALSAAHTTFPMPSYARVTNLENNRSIIVRVNDRGPYKHNRIIDMSQRAAEILDFKRKGTANVRVQYAGPAPLNGDDRYERQALRRQPWAAHIVEAKADNAPLQPSPRLIQANYGGAGQFPQSGQPGMSSTSRPNGVVAAAPRLFMQTGLFRDPINAEAFRRRMEGIGPAQMTQVDMGAEVLHRVDIGPFANEDAARRAMTDATRFGVRDAQLFMR